jgi:hypothetical protein
LVKSACERQASGAFALAMRGDYKTDPRQRRNGWRETCRRRFLSANSGNWKSESENGSVTPRFAGWKMFLFCFT